MIDMSRLRTSCVLCVAVLAATLGVTNAAFAVPPLPSVLPGESAWKGKAIGATLVSTVGGQLIRCVAATATGTLEFPTKTLGEYHAAFEKCEEPSTGVHCTGVGDETGTILAFGTWHSVVDVNSPELHGAILFLPGEVSFKCSIVPIRIEHGGMVLCLSNEPLSSKASHEAACKTVKSGGKDTGKPEDTKYFSDKEEVSISPLRISVNGGALEEASIEGTRTVEFKEAQKMDD
jgi:hypothetical protein